MTDSAFITMMVVLSLVWGGFSALLFYAMRRESRKRRAEEGSKS
jgi:heme/copper-type cytochrome/quinol oxidase subunit 2